MVMIAAGHRKFFYQSSVKADRGMLRSVVAGCHKSLKFVIFKTATRLPLSNLLHCTKASLDLGHA
jgi:hypothetical protein